jgi:hypothetical protein
LAHYFSTILEYLSLSLRNYLLNHKGIVFLKFRSESI